MRRKRVERVSPAPPRGTLAADLPSLDFTKMEWQCVNMVWIFGMKKRGLVRHPVAEIELIMMGDVQRWHWKIKSLTNPEEGECEQLLRAVLLVEQKLGVPGV